MSKHSTEDEGLREQLIEQIGGLTVGDEPHEIRNFLGFESLGVVADFVMAHTAGQVDAWNALLDRAAAGEVVKVTHNGVDLSINSLDGMHDGMRRVVESAMTLGEEISKHKGGRPRGGDMEGENGL